MLCRIDQAISDWTRKFSQYKDFDFLDKILKILEAFANSRGRQCSVLLKKISKVIQHVGHHLSSDARYRERLWELLDKDPGFQRELLFEILECAAFDNDSEYRNSCQIPPQPRSPQMGLKSQSPQAIDTPREPDIFENLDSHRENLFGPRKTWSLPDLQDWVEIESDTEQESSSESEQMFEPVSLQKLKLLEKPIRLPELLSPILPSPQPRPSSP